MPRTKIHKPLDRELIELSDDWDPIPESMEESIVAESRPTAPAVTDEAVRDRAYQIWEAAGWPATDGVEFWLQAERELRAS